MYEITAWKPPTIQLFLVAVLDFARFVCRRLGMSPFWLWAQKSPVAPDDFGTPRRPCLRISHVLDQLRVCTDNNTARIKREQAAFDTDHAPCGAERPDNDGVRDGGERDADDDEEKVGDRETDDERVGRAAHLQVGHHDDDHRQVADEAEDGDDAEQDWHDDAYDRLEWEDPRLLVGNRAAAAAGAAGGRHVQPVRRRRRLHRHSVVTTACTVTAAIWSLDTTSLRDN